MRRRTLILGITIGAAALVLAFVATLGVLSRSEAGTRWVLDRVQAAMGDSLAIDAVEGALGNRLTLRGVSYGQPGLQATVESVDLRWKLTALLSGQLEIEALTVTGVQVLLSETDEPPTPDEPFDPGSLRPPVDVSLASLVLQDLMVTMPDGSGYPITRVEAELYTRASMLELRSLTVSAPQGNLAASLTADLTDELPVDGTLDWNTTLPDERKLGGLLSLSGDMQRLEIQHQGRGAVALDVRGSAVDLLAVPSWEVALSWPDSLLYTSPEQSVRSAGALSSRGSLDGFSLQGEGTADVTGIAPVRWGLDALGTGDALDIQTLAVSSAPYEVALDGRVGWAGNTVADLNYTVSAAELQTLSPALPPRLDASGAVSIDYRPERVVVKDLTLALEQSAMTLQADGQVDLTDSANPLLALNLSWRDLGWPLDTGSDVASPSGSASIDGALQDWRAQLAADVTGSQVPAGSWSGRLRGDEASARIEELTGNTLDGVITARGDVSWAPQTSWTLAVTGDALNPEAFVPDLPGKLSFELATEGSLPDAGELQASLLLSRAGGTLAGYPVELAADALLAGELVTLHAFSAASGENKLSGSGTVQGDDLSLQWELLSPQIGSLLADASGSVTASGTVAGTTAKPRLAMSAAGRNLAMAEVQIATLDATVQAGLDAADPLSIKLDLAGPAGDSSAVLELLQLEAKGTTAKHSITLYTVAAGISADTRLVGGLDSELTWAGVLEGLGVNPGDPIGRWESASPAALSLSAESVELEKFCLRAAAGGEGRVCTEALWQSTTGVQLSGSVADLQLVRILPDVTGQLDGDFALAMTGAGDADGRASFGISSGALRFDTGQGVQRLQHGGGSLTATIGASGLEARLVARPLAEGEILADVALPQLSRLPPEGPQPLAGRLSANLPDLSGLQAWVPDLDRVRGRVAGELALAGELARPRITGDIGLRDGSADVPAAGLSLRQVELGLSGDATRPELLNIDGGLLSGDGSLSLAGQVDMDTGGTTLEIEGDRLEIFNTADAVALLSPRLTADWGEGRLKLRGTIAVNRADITPRLSLRSAAASDHSAAVVASGNAVPPSPDVVVLGAETTAPGEETPLPFQLDSEIVVDLGQRVRVNALGFAGRITGLVIFTNPPERSDIVPIARGAFEVQEGTFRSFGQDLEIQTGQLLFRAVPATEPEVNLRAVRWIDNDPLVTLAGVRVTGPLEQPELELYSTPQLEMTEIQSYLLTGRSPSSRDSALSIGTFIRPKLYVGYGYNLLEETSEFDALYTISPRYGAQASVGEADNNIGVTFTYEH